MTQAFSAASGVPRNSSTRWDQAVLPLLLLLVLASSMAAGLVQTYLRGHTGPAFPADSPLPAICDLSVFLFREIIIALLAIGLGYSICQILTPASGRTPVRVRKLAIVAGLVLFCGDLWGSYWVAPLARDFCRAAETSHGKTHGILKQRNQVLAERHLITIGDWHVDADTPITSQQMYVFWPLKQSYTEPCYWEAN